MDDIISIVSNEVRGKVNRDVNFYIDMTRDNRLIIYFMKNGPVGDCDKRVVEQPCTLNERIHDRDYIVLCSVVIGDGYYIINHDFRHRESYKSFRFADPKFSVDVLIENILDRAFISFKIADENDHG